MRSSCPSFPCVPRMFALALLLIVCPARAFAKPAVLSRITFDARSDAGLLKPLRGVNGPPNITFLGSDPRLHGSLLDETKGYLAAHINLVRTHDSGGLADLDSSLGALPPLVPITAARRAAIAATLARTVIFPHPAADPSSPASYHFGPTDRLIEGIRKIGAEVLFRLGREGMTTAPPPSDLTRYAEIIHHVVLHYDEGWDHGMYGAVRYWEVWNEPDLGHIWWRGTPQQYYALYAAAAKAVKSADPEAWVGGPTIALVNQKTPYREGFLAYVRAHHLPLNFFSWHWYSVRANDPYQFVEIARRMRTLLDRYGFFHTRSFLDEWNYDFTEIPRTPPIQVASFVATSLIYMQDAPIDVSALYRADHDFKASGVPRNPTGQVLIDLGTLADTPIRLSGTGTNRSGLAVLGGRNADGNRINLVVSNYQIPKADMGPAPDGLDWHVDHLFSMQILPRRTVHYPPHRRYELIVRHLPEGQYRFVRNRLTTHGVSTLRQIISTRGTIMMRFSLPAYVVDAIQIERLPPHRTSVHSAPEDSP